MKSILSALYAGEISPMEQNFPKTEEYLEIHRRQHQSYKAFVELLQKREPSLTQKFIEIMNEQSEAIPLELSAAFANGFRLGAKIMMEVLQED